LARFTGKPRCDQHVAAGRGEPCATSCAATIDSEKKYGLVHARLRTPCSRNSVQIFNTRIPNWMPASYLPAVPIGSRTWIPNASARAIAISIYGIRPIILEALIEGQFVAVAAVRAARPALERAGRAIEARLKPGGGLVYAGAGTSGRPAVQDGAELMPTFSWPADRLLLLIAGGNEGPTRSRSPARPG
jgi:hypothetical protein